MCSFTLCFLSFLVELTSLLKAVLRSCNHVIRGITWKKNLSNNRGHHLDVETQ